MLELRLLALAFVVLCLAPRCCVGVTVNTTCGEVLGTIDPLADGTGAVASFRSIPYAAAPIPRWNPPVPAPCWEGTFNATLFGPHCVQAGGDGAEDCLALTVYVPLSNGSNSLPSPTAKLPVMFYIHGGGLMGGSGNFEVPQPFAVRTTSIVVCINYRLNIFGFLALSSLTATSPRGTSGNYGILDQQLALQWVQENIARFGGDPTRVTVAGQSSGGTSIFALMASPLSKGLFSAAIPLSGSPNISMDLSAAQVQNSGVPVKLQCSQPNNPAAEVACLQAANVSSLISAMPYVWNTPGIWGIDFLQPSGMGELFGGLPIVDGVVLTDSFAGSMASGLIDVPLIMGGMAQECEDGPGNKIRGQSLEQWRGELSAWLSRWGNASAALTDGVYSWYLSDALLDVQRAYDTFNADYSTACAFAEIAVAAKAGGKYKSPIYIFNNAWQPSVPIYSHGGSFNLTWAYHTWDYRAAFENWPTPSIQPFPNATDRALSSFLQSAWGQLMSNGKLDPAITAGWDSVDAVPGFPAHYGMQRISSPDLIPFEPNMFVTDLKANFCGNLAAFGFDSRFWWVD